MNSLVRSNPADDLRARRRVLITSPDGRTTVYEPGYTWKKCQLLIYLQRLKTTLPLLFHIELRWLEILC